MSKASGAFKVTNWDEKPYQEGAGKQKLTRATVTQTFSGDIEGEGATEYLMAYNEDGTAEFVGVQQIDGAIDGKTGRIVLRLEGAFVGKKAHADWSIVEGAGSGDLAKLSGKGGFDVPMGKEGAYALEFSFS